MEQRLSMVSLGVNNIKNSTEFYQRLGWIKSKAASKDEISFFQMGGIALAIYDREMLAAEANLKINSGNGFGGIALAHNARSETEVNDILALAEKSGGKILKTARKVFWGGYSGYFKDIDNHVWEVAFNPYMEITKDGSIKLPD